MLPTWTPSYVSYSHIESHKEYFGWAQLAVSLLSLSAKYRKPCADESAFGIPPSAIE